MNDIISLTERRKTKHTQEAMDIAVIFAAIQALVDATQEINTAIHAFALVSSESKKRLVSQITGVLEDDDLQALYMLLTTHGKNLNGLGEALKKANPALAEVMPKTGWVSSRANEYGRKGDTFFEDYFLCRGRGEEALTKYLEENSI